MADGNRMVFLGFGKYARADKIYAIEPIRDERRGARAAHARLGRGRERADRRVAHGAHDPRRHGPGRRRSASRCSTRRSTSRERLAEQSQTGAVDLADLGRRARRLLEATARPDDPEKLF